MKYSSAMPYVIAIFALTVFSSTATMTSEHSEDRTISKVVKLLQDMLKTSKKDGDEERVIYAKFKCYCDTSEAEKKADIEELTKTISLLESQIEELQGSNGEESSSSAELKEKIAENKQAQAEATAIREKQEKAFEAEKEDLEQAIEQMKQAIETLSAVGADQTMKTGADHKQFMAGYKDKAESSMLQLREALQSALSVAQSFASEKQYNSVASFIQAPFTGTYTSQSAEVLGILKNMRETFGTNLQAAIEQEDKEATAYKELMKVKAEELDKLLALYKKAQAALGDNDQGLALKRKQLSEAEKQKTSDEEFLAELIPMCKEKAKEYEKRKVLRVNEEAAIAEAISILNSDSAFETFGTVDATSTGSTAFIQLSSVKKHIPEEDVRIVMQRLLQRAAAEEGNKSPRINHVMSLLNAENPFDTVLTEIDKMIELINAESKQDKENLMWCGKERKTNKAELAEKKDEILKLEGEIDRLDKEINEPETGLKAQIAATEKSLVENDEAQKTETADRQEENLAYQKDIKNLVSAEALLENAIKVLKGYYDKLDKSFVQEDPAPPETWGKKYEGQSKGGNDAISMLEFILGETKKEEDAAHSGEEKAQADYEDSMTLLKKEQAKKEKSLAALQKSLADAEKDLLQAEEDLKATVKDKEAIEAYLLKIKPGCDFITENYKLRTENRVTEKEALEKAKKMLKDSPAYKNAERESEIESFGKCKKFCETKREGVECKACLADVTIPGYCAGHPGTEGC